MNLFMDHKQYFIPIDESELLTLIGVSIAFPDGCYSVSSSLMVISGSNVLVEDCYYTCSVSFIRIQDVVCLLFEKKSSLLVQCMIEIFILFAIFIRCCNYMYMYMYILHGYTTA